MQPEFVKFNATTIFLFISELNDEHLTHVLLCVNGKVAAEVNAKLEQVRERLGCGSVLCGIRKVCEINGGTLENARANQTSVLTDDDNAALRSAFYACRPSDAAHANITEVPPASEATPEATPEA